MMSPSTLLQAACHTPMHWVVSLGQPASSFVYAKGWSSAPGYGSEPFSVSSTDWDRSVEIYVDSANFVQRGSRPLWSELRIYPTRTGRTRTYTDDEISALKMLIVGEYAARGDRDPDVDVLGALIMDRLAAVKRNQVRTPLKGTGRGRGRPTKSR